MSITTNDEHLAEELLSENQLKGLYRRVFSSDDGKLVLKDLEDMAKFRSPLSLDVNEMQRQEGARILFLRILELATSPLPKGTE